MDNQPHNIPDEKKQDKNLNSTLSQDARAARELQSKIASLGTERAAQIAELKEIGVKLRTLSPKVNELKAARDKETLLTKEFKLKRQAATDALKPFVEQLKTVAALKEDAVKKTSKERFRRSPSQLAAEIASIELKIETEVIPFEKEKELMKTIKEKKKQLDAIKSVSEASKAHRELFSKVAELRGQSHTFHREVESHAAQSQKMHEEMVALIPKLRELRERGKELAGLLDKTKGEYASAHSSLKGTLHEITEVRRKMSVEVQVQAQERRKQLAAQAESELSAKLKSGKKLTTRDLMMLQDK